MAECWLSTGRAEAREAHRSGIRDDEALAEALVLEKTEEICCPAC
jgi:hypothetical protein